MQFFSWTNIQIINNKRQKINFKQIAKTNQQNPNSFFLDESCKKKDKSLDTRN